MKLNKAFLAMLVAAPLLCSYSATAMQGAEDPKDPEDTSIILTSTATSGVSKGGETGEPKPQQYKYGVKDVLNRPSKDIAKPKNLVGYCEGAPVYVNKKFFKEINDAIKGVKALKEGQNIQHVTKIKEEEEEDENKIILGNDETTGSAFDFGDDDDSSNENVNNNNNNNNAEVSFNSLLGGGSKAPSLTENETKETKSDKKLITEQPEIQEDENQGEHEEKKHTESVSFGSLLGGAPSASKTGSFMKTQADLDKIFSSGYEKGQADLEPELQELTQKVTDIKAQLETAQAANIQKDTEIREKDTEIRELTKQAERLSDNLCK